MSEAAIPDDDSGMAHFVTVVSADVVIYAVVTRGALLVARGLAFGLAYVTRKA